VGVLSNTPPDPSGRTPLKGRISSTPDLPNNSPIYLNFFHNSIFSSLFLHIGRFLRYKVQKTDFALDSRLE